LGLGVEVRVRVLASQVSAIGTEPMWWSAVYSIPESTIGRALFDPPENHRTVMSR